MVSLLLCPRMCCSSWVMFKSSWMLIVPQALPLSLQIEAAPAAAANLLQSCPTLCNPIDSSPPGSTVPGVLQARTLEWAAISFSNAWQWKVKVKSLSRVRLFATPWTAAYQTPPSMGFSRQEYWSGVPLPSPQIEETLDTYQEVALGSRRKSWMNLILFPARLCVARRNLKLFHRGHLSWFWSINNWPAVDQSLQLPRYYSILSCGCT